MAKSVEEMKESMLKNLEVDSGILLPQWLKIVEVSGKKKHKEILDFLKDEHGLTYGYANFLALKAREVMAGTVNADPVELQYAGPKAELRPLYDKIITAVQSFGEDVEISPKKNYVSLRRSKQFGLVQPSTRSRVDVGLVLSDSGTGDRLEAAGSFNSMMTHRVRLTELGHVDEELVAWLKQAYDQA